MSPAAATTPSPASRVQPREVPAPNGFLGMQGIGPERLRSMLALARDFRGARELPRPLEGRLVANFFLEDSTRTRLSFSAAAMALGARVVELTAAASSVNKGETIIDSARILESQGVAAIVVRARQSGAPHMIARAVSCPVLNAGDGRHEHPTQALLDALTIADAFNRTDDFDLTGLTVAIVGDVASSRVARSNIAALTTLGARVVCVGPGSFAPRSLESLGAAVTNDLDPVVPAADAIMMLRIQFERHAGHASHAASAAAGPSGGASHGSPSSLAGASASGAQAAIASIREYRAFYALTQDRAKLMKPSAILLHPGPINRGIELDAPVADGPSSRILQQARNGLFARAAALAHIAAQR
jgi:aspartate carbamoyltransferase catalytic subunit